MKLEATVPAERTYTLHLSAEELADLFAIASATTGEQSSVRRTTGKIYDVVTSLIVSPGLNHNEVFNTGVQHGYARSNISENSKYSNLVQQLK